MDRTIRTCESKQFDIKISFKLSSISLWINHDGNGTFSGCHSHFIEIRNGCDVDEVDDGKVFYFFGDWVENFVHLHATWVPIVSESNHLEGKSLQIFDALGIINENFITTRRPKAFDGIIESLKAKRGTLIRRWIKNLFQKFDLKILFLNNWNRIQNLYHWSDV